MSNVKCQVNKVILSLYLFVEDVVQGVRKQRRYGSSWVGTLGAFQPRAPGNRPDAITPPWTELGYPRLVRLRVRGPDARCICGRVVTAGASRSPLGRRSPPRLPGAPSPGGSVAALLLRRDRDDPRFTQRPHNGGGASHASLDRSLDRVLPPSEEVRGADPSDRPSGWAIGPARTDHARWLPGVFPTRRR